MPTDRVVLEATGNALAIARIIEPHVEAVVLAHAKHVRAISHAKIKTDKVDARVLADLLAADLVPAVWVGDDASVSLTIVKSLSTVALPLPTARGLDAVDADQRQRRAALPDARNRAAGACTTPSRLVKSVRMIRM